MTFASTTDTTYTLMSLLGTHYVEKMMMGVSIEAPWSLPCMAAVKAPPMKLPPTALDSYVRTIPSECGAPMQEEVCYMSPAKTHRLVWGNQPKYSAAESLIYMEGTEG